MIDSKLAASAILKYQAGDSISNIELNEGIKALRQTTGLTSKLGSKYTLFHVNFINMLDQFESFKSEREKYND